MGTNQCEYGQIRLICDVATQLYFVALSQKWILFDTSLEYFKILFIVQFKASWVKDARAVLLYMYSRVKAGVGDSLKHL